MRKSFIKKIFSGVVTLLFFIFIIQFIFQTVIFPKYFLEEVKTNIEDNLSNLLVEDSNFLDSLYHFSEDTQTVSTITSYDDIATMKRSLTEIALAGEENHIIYIPLIAHIEVENGDLIEGTFIEYQEQLFPKVIYLNGEKIYGAMMKRKSISQTPGDSIQISGEVSNVVMHFPTGINDYTFSQELLNIATNNYSDYELSTYGFSYISKNVDGENQNLVYVSLLDNDSEENILLSIYSLGNVKAMSSRISSFTTITFALTFILLIGLSAIYLRKVSLPLIRINEKTKRLSNLDFDITLEDYQSEDEIGELSKSINILSTNLKNALYDLNVKNYELSESIERDSNRDRIRNDFVTSISHELKTPLAIILASHEAIANNVFQSETDIKIQYEVIKKEINRSNELINQMLNIYKLDQPELQSEWQEVNLQDITEHVHKSQISLAKSKDINIQVNTLPYYVYGDKSKLEIVVSNILSNAIKYTPRNESIFIEINSKGLSIINTGITIADDDINNLFEPFYRTDKAKTRKDGSSGLGLYIVKQILNQHDIKFKIENIEKGVKFSMRK